jgi:ABC-type sugar transport system ATPase subunit
MAVAAQGISKSFPGTRALDRVDLSVGAGEVHALLGANGSGKSTLVKVLSGVYQPDEGELRVGDTTVRAIHSPNEAHALGVAVVHQESPLVDTLTVAECVALFRGYPTSHGRIRWRSVRQQTRALLDRFGVAVDPGTLAGLLSPAERALVALAIALERIEAHAGDVNLLILDEVTASLPEDQGEAYLRQVGALARTGTPVLMVTHRLSELHDLATHVTVLRDGQRVYHDDAGADNDDTLIRHIIGVEREPTAGTHERVDRAAAVEQLWTGRHGGGRRTVLEAEHLAGELVRDVSFTLGAGEIVGIGGLVESGVGELPQLLAGARPRTGGTLRVDGRVLAADATPRDVIEAGLALLPADRLRSGGIASLSVKENVVLPDARSYWHRSDAERSTLRRLIERLDVRPPSPAALFGSLSGGNQQKVLLGKWLLLGPSVIVLDDPTSGVDPGARETIFSILREAASEGLSALLFSTELEQLVAMCSRVLVLRDGAVATELAGAELTRETVTKWCYS